MGGIPVAALVPIAVAVVVGGVVLGRIVARRQAEAWATGVRGVVEAIRGAAAAERTLALKAAELSGREQALALGSAFETFAAVREAELGTVLERVLRREGELEAQLARHDARREALEAGRARVAAHDGQVSGLRAEVAASARATQAALEKAGGEPAAAIRAAIVEGELDDARRAAALSARATEVALADESVRGAKRVMGIAVGRFAGHYLTERPMSIVPVPPGPAGQALIGADERNLRAIEAVAGIKLALAEGRDALRVEGLDGVGRELARRTLARLQRDPRAAATPDDVTRTARELAASLDRELADLGRRAFSTLEIAPAHPEIVKLVGRLNYRTSYTQNQWKHAIEAGFLCGMMAEELGLDARLARRAALMHDIGKALTHELDGSHAVIGADYARRLGEPEVVANAIGAHHTDEPFGSAYAYLVAAADAMSGARPGARRQTDESFVSRLDELERITRTFRGIGEAFAVQGGRELRVYVEEDRVDDLGAVDLSSAIARKISEEMRFPGQIRVTVIREFKAVETAS
jgi:ribonuclease Y